MLRCGGPPAWQGAHVAAPEVSQLKPTQTLLTWICSFKVVLRLLYGDCYEPHCRVGEKCYQSWEKAANWVTSEREANLHLRFSGWPCSTGDAGIGLATDMLGLQDVVSSLIGAPTVGSGMLWNVSSVYSMSHMAHLLWKFLGQNVQPPQQTADQISGVLRK